METKFNSQICTTREQSERLIALGLKKETADMVWNVDWCCSEDVEMILALCEHHPNQYSPAWSLHRLMILAATPLELDEMLGYNVYDYYDNAINHIESLIKDGYFNKEYLEE